MDMSTSTSMAMSMATTTDSMASMTSAAAMASSTAMDSMSMGDGCKISMLWNWYTIDACFISSTWRVRTSGAFAGSCIGIILLVMVLEGLRRAAKEYDAFIVRQATRSLSASNPPQRDPAPAAESETNKSPLMRSESASLPGRRQQRMFKPSILQQMVRAGLHMLQFAVAYFVMLMAMYYNGYIIICILLGAFLGAFAFSWQAISISSEEPREITYCCG